MQLSKRYQSGVAVVVAVVQVAWWQDFPRSCLFLYPIVPFDSSTETDDTYTRSYRRQGRAKDNRPTAREWIGVKRTRKSHQRTNEQTAFIH